jgi:hypothetical protein
MRILITGSRGWKDRAAIHLTLTEAVGLHGPGYPVTVVSGACPMGADRLCEEEAERNGWTVERHPADWDARGRSAGFRRNKHMVDLGADLCLAFISDCTSPRCDKPQPHLSHGASHTADLAEKAGITVRRHYLRKDS